MFVDAELPEWPTPTTLADLHRPRVLAYTPTVAVYGQFDVFTQDVTFILMYTSGHVHNSLYVTQRVWDAATVQARAHRQQCIALMESLPGAAASASEDARLVARGDLEPLPPYTLTIFNHTGTVADDGTWVRHYDLRRSDDPLRTIEALDIGPNTSILMSNGGRFIGACKRLLEAGYVWRSDDDHAKYDAVCTWFSFMPASETPKRVEE